MASVVNSGSADFDKGGSATVTLGAAPTSGNILVCGATLTSITDVSTITNSLIDTGAGKVTFGASAWVRLYYRECDGTEVAATTVTLAGGSVNGSIWVAEYDTVDNFLADGGGTTGSGTALTGTNPASGTPDLNVVMYGIDGASRTFSSPQSGWAIEAQGGTGDSSWGAIHQLSGHASEHGTVTLDTSDDWGGIHATFETASAGGMEIYTLRNALGY